MKLLATLALAVVMGTGCTAFNPRTLTQPTPTPKAAFEYNLHTIVSDAEGNEQVNPGDVIRVDQEALKDNWSINLNREYYDTTQMPIEAVRAVADVLKIHATTGNAPSNEQLLLYSGAIETAADYSIPLILKSEQTDVQRANDPEAFAAARVAQFGAAADLAKFQTSEARKVIQSLTPTGAAAGAFDRLAQVVEAKQAQAAIPTPVAPEPEPEPNPAEPEPNP